MAVASWTHISEYSMSNSMSCGRVNGSPPSAAAHSARFVYTSAGFTTAACAASKAAADAEAAALACSSAAAVSVR